MQDMETNISEASGVDLKKQGPSKKLKMGNLSVN